MPRAGTPLLVGVLFHELQGRTGVRQRVERSKGDEVGRVVLGARGTRTDMAGWIPEERRLPKLWVQARLLENLFQGVADSLAGARTRDEGKYRGVAFSSPSASSGGAGPRLSPVKEMEKEGTDRRRSREGRGRDGGLKPHVEGSCSSGRGPSLPFQPLHFPIVRQRVCTSTGTGYEWW